MCWHTIRHEPDALAKGVIDVKNIGEPASGGHSWGYAYIDEDGELQAEWGVGEIPDDLTTPYTDTALVHTRFATRGVINEENAHPFGIWHDGEVVGYLCHNGTWYEAPTEGTQKADSYFIARKVEQELMDAEDFDTALWRAAREVGETILVLHQSGDCYAYSGRFDICMAEDGDVIRSSHGTDIPDGSLVKIPAEE